MQRALDACLAGRESSENRRAGVTAAGPFGVSTTREVGRFFLLVCTCELTQKGTYHALEVSWKGDVCSHTHSYVQRSASECSTRTANRTADAKPFEIAFVQFPLVSTIAAA